MFVSFAKSWDGIVESKAMDKVNLAKFERITKYSGDRYRYR